MNAREQILADVRLALRRRTDSLVAPIPVTARVAPRVTQDIKSDMDALFAEITKLGGNCARVHRDGLREQIAKLVNEQAIKKATLWQTRELEDLGLAGILRDLNVELVSSHADKRALAECDLGITGADAAMPETGTLLLRSSPEKPRAVSLLPRIHLAILNSSILRADLVPAFADVKDDGYFVFVTGPSRTADIELTVTIGVHGPKALFVWQVE